MKLTLLACVTFSLLVSLKAEPVTANHAGFFTPQRKGKMWDTWMYFNEGKFHLFYLGGDFLKWDAHALAVSPDGVHWEDRGTTLERSAGVIWMGTGHIWEAPDFAKSHTWISNYSEHIGDKQDIKFATSTDLLRWTKADEKFHFVQDTRWYKAKGRWDCIDTIKRADGGFYGYFTADPDPDKVKYKCCGFGFAESKDGLNWTALPPIEGDMTGEFGGIQQIGNKYFILIGEGRVGVGDKPEGPFLAQKKNLNVFGEGCEIYFPRFFHNAPGGPLVNHFYNNDSGRNGDVYSGPLKAVEVDKEGTLRLKWWNGNEKIKAIEIANSTREGGASLKLLTEKLDLSHTYVMEGTVETTQNAIASAIYFELENSQGRCLRFTNNAVQFGEIKADGSDFKALQTSNRDLDMGAAKTFRLVFRHDMVELYVNDHLMNLKRFIWNGQLGFISENSGDAFKNVRIWRSK